MSAPRLGRTLWSIVAVLLVIIAVSLVWPPTSLVRVLAAVAVGVTAPAIAFNGRFGDRAMFRMNVVSAGAAAAAIVIALVNALSTGESPQTPLVLLVLFGLELARRLARSRRTGADP